MARKTFLCSCTRTLHPVRSLTHQHRCCKVPPFSARAGARVQRSWRCSTSMACECAHLCGHVCSEPDRITALWPWLRLTSWTSNLRLLGLGICRSSLSFFRKLGALHGPPLPGTRWHGFPFAQRQRGSCDSLIAPCHKTSVEKSFNLKVSVLLRKYQKIVLPVLCFAGQIRHHELCTHARSAGSGMPS